MNNKGKPAFQLSTMAFAVLTCLSVNAEEQTKNDKDIERVEVLGSNIKRAQVADTLPITVMNSDDIAATGAATGEELLRSIPQIGEMAFNNERAIGGVNDARGDVSSINLRGLGTGNTLTLLNGRRLVLHPGTQTENFVPVSTVNANTLPVSGLKRVEVLRDGAAAIYGSDAVAGVVNYVLKDDYEGSGISVNHGSSEGTALSQTSLSGATGLAFNEDKTHLTLSLSLYDRKGMPASDRDYSASQDRREYSTLPEEYIGDTQLDNRSTSTPWGEFSTSSLKTFHIQPNTMSGCVVELGDGLCADKGSLSRDMRYDSANEQSMTSDVQRANFYGYLNHELDDDLTLFSEAIYYQAETRRLREQSGNLTAQRFTISPDAYYNPFGEMVTVRRYRPIDSGQRNIQVKDTSFRLLTGLSGYYQDWDWESAVLYSEAKTHDKARNRVDANAFFAAVNSTEAATAYNIFNGGDPSNLNSGDATANLQSVIDQFSVTIDRESKTSLALADFKVSNAALFDLIDGEVGMASGAEFRRETYADNRDPLLNGSQPFIDTNTGNVLSGSSVLGSSETPDSDGSRNVFSAYVELVAPLLSDRMLAKSLEIQLAARYENFSDVGSVTKPKVALSWMPSDWLQVRAAYAEGFRAPNLPQVVEQGISRSNTRYDPVTDSSYGITEIRGGNKNLKPEDDTNTSFGLVLMPFNDLTITADWWQIEQDGVVGILNSQTHLMYDSLLRSQGSSNPDVIRGEDNEVIHVNNQYNNLNPREIEGVDFSVFYDLKTEFGNFDFKLNAARLIRFEQEPDAITAEVIAAQEAGNPAVPESVVITGAGDLMKQNGRPEWRAYASLRFKRDQWSLGTTANYVSDFYDTSTTTSEGEPLPIDSFTTINAYADYRFEQSGWFSDTRIRLGVRNINDKKPPIADESFGYFSSVHSNRGRYYYLDFSKSF
ncbi:TonB-dependent receptor domain-containing protein [Pseudoalteromonas sp.]|uniref:TonB-dependent receptor domain-containing protein n=1 Tax=Pseudoalteromonas sp. TaxID=53249 RepID=UPI0035615FF0